MKKQSIFLILFGVLLFTTVMAAEESPLTASGGGGEKGLIQKIKRQEIFRISPGREQITITRKCPIECKCGENEITCIAEEETIPETNERPALEQCVLSLCDCKCHLKGESQEEKTGKLCGINCFGLYNISGCAFKNGECAEVYRTEIKRIKTDEAGVEAIEEEEATTTCPVGCTCADDSISCPTSEEVVAESEIQTSIETIEGIKAITIRNSSPNQVSLHGLKVAAFTREKLILEENKLSLETEKGEKQIRVLPDLAYRKTLEKEVQEIKEVELKQEAEKPIFSVRGTKKAKLFFLFPVTLNIETKIDAETSEILSVRKPWWSFFAR